ncbi:MAG: NAD(+)/NADH kinase [Bacteroidia bacterium]
MKRIALFGRWTGRIQVEILEQWQALLESQGVEVCVEERFAQAWGAVSTASRRLLRFQRREELEGVEMAFVIGGDGAFLEAARIVAPSGIPLVGVHAGRLGFLTDIPQEKLLPATQALLAGRYTLEQRSLLSITTEPELLQPAEAFALNEVVFSKALSGEMILIDVYLNGELINTYWADGLIVATPTGSTAYSLACGGPILTPTCTNFVLTPMAPHALTVRSLVIPDSGVLTITFQSRTGEVQMALDGRNYTLSEEVAVALRRAPITLKLLKLPSTSYFRTLRDRLAWGIDRREPLRRRAPSPPKADSSTI